MTDQEPTNGAGVAVVDTEIPHDSVSQGRQIARRFFTNRIAMVALLLLILIVLLSITSIGLGPIPGWWKYNFRQLNPQVQQGLPTLSLMPEWLGGAGVHLGEHPFGQDRLGTDYFAMTMRGIQNSTLVMVVLGLIASVVGVTVGAIAGYFRGWVDALLMRVTDVFIVIPALVVGSIVGHLAGGLGPLALAVLLGLFTWMGIARLVRGEFLSLRERAFVEAARVAGASDVRIIFRHILPNAIGVVIVSSTLIMATAILLEAALSFLGYGIRSPEVSLGQLIVLNQTAFATRPWLYWWPAGAIVMLALLVNFIGDGLRDAFDPRHRRFNRRRMRELDSPANTTDTRMRPA